MIVADVVHVVVAAVVVVVEEAFHIIIFDQIRNYAQLKKRNCVSVTEASKKRLAKICVCVCVFFSAVLGHDLWQEAVQQTPMPMWLVVAGKRCLCYAIEIEIESSVMDSCSATVQHSMSMHPQSGGQGRSRDRSHCVPATVTPSDTHLMDARRSLSFSFCVCVCILNELSILNAIYAPVS